MSRTRWIAAALAAAALVFASSTSAASLRQTRCSTSQPARAELACGRANLHRGTAALRFLRHHRGAGTSRSRASVRRAGRYLVRYGARHVRLASGRTLPWAFWDCVATGRLHGRTVSVGEGGLDSYNPSGPYYGRYQMDPGFMSKYGSDMLRRHHGRDARSWTLLEQTIVAERGFKVQGAGAWGRTAPPCMSLRN